VSSHFETAENLRRLQAAIDFESERYYNLYLDASAPELDPDLDERVWADVSSLTADLNRFRGELARLRRGIEDLRMPAVETVGLDRLAGQLESANTRLAQLSQQLKPQREPDAKGPVRSLIKDLLPVLDAVDRVFELSARQPGALSDSVRTGLESVYKLLLDTLSRSGLEPIELKAGDPFNPEEQLAMSTEPHPQLPEGSISQVLTKGYRFEGKLLRTAQVVIVKQEQERHETNRETQT
jgi:molecular chaperone GrpE